MFFHYTANENVDGDCNEDCGVSVSKQTSCDNSSAHNSLVKDALTVTKMNVGPGGKNTPDMHDTVVPADNAHG